MRKLKTACKNGVWLQAWEGDYGERRLFFSPPCKLKSCEACSRAKRFYHVARIATQVESEPDLHWYFVTATARAKYHKAGNVDESLNSLRASWSRVRKRLNRRFSLVLWVKVYERHKSGIYHLHALIGVNGRLSERYIRKIFFQTGAGYMIKRKILEAVYHVRYVAKYATKSDVPIRAIEYSRNFKKLAEHIPDSPLNWSYMGKLDISRYTEGLLESGIEVIMLSDIYDNHEDDK